MPLTIPTAATVQVWVASNGLRIILWFVVAVIIFLAGARVAMWRGDSKLNALKAEYAELTAKAEADARRRETALQEIVNANRKTLDADRKTIKAKDVALAAFRADSQQLRNALSSYAADNASGATCDERIAKLGQLAGRGTEILERGRGLLRGCAGDNATHEAEASAAIGAWPK